MKKIILVVVALSLSACVNLKHVSDFANESAKLAAYTELTTHWRDTYERIEPYLEPSTLQGESIIDKKRKSVYADLIEIHKGVTLYMKSLSMLASTETFDLSPQINQLKDSILEHPEFNIKKDEVTAYSNIFTALSNHLLVLHQKLEIK